MVRLPPRSVSRLTVASLIASALGACGSSDTETELRELIAEAEQAAEDRNTRFFRGLVSERYADSRGYDREELITLLRGYFLAHPQIEVINRIESVELPGEDIAHLTVLTGVVGQRDGASLLSGLDGDLHRLELEFVREGGDWQVIGAQWERSRDD